MEYWSDGALEYWKKGGIFSELVLAQHSEEHVKKQSSLKPNTPKLQYSEFIPSISHLRPQRDYVAFRVR